MELIAAVEAFFRSARRSIRSPSVKVFDAADDGGPWYRCPDCGILWQPAFNPGCQRVRARVHECWVTDRQAG